jgi:hypothetical protein
LESVFAVENQIPTQRVRAPSIRHVSGNRGGPTSSIVRRRSARTWASNTHCWFEIEYACKSCAAHYECELNSACATITSRIQRLRGLAPFKRVIITTTGPGLTQR